jgi:hypothetical protein
MTFANFWATGIGRMLDNEVIDQVHLNKASKIDRLKLLALELALKAIHAKPRIMVECDSATSQIMEVEAGRGIALVITALKPLYGKCLLYGPLAGTTEKRSLSASPAP